MTNKLIILNDKMIIDLITMWGEFIVFNPIPKITKSIMYSNMAIKMNEKHKCTSFNALQLARKTQRLKQNYIKVCIN